jgi:hypothetical protein
MLDLPSLEIGRHPEVKKNPGNVDVILQRCRTTMRDCMRRKEHDLTHVPRGTFTAIWERLRVTTDPDRERAFNE